MFSYSMKLELCNLGIDCTAFILGPVNTGFSNNRTVVTAEDSRYFKDVREVDDFVKNQDNSKKTSTKKVSAYIIKKLGKTHLRYHYIVGFGFRLAYVFYKFFPFTTFRLTNFFMRKREK